MSRKGDQNATALREVAGVFAVIEGRGVPRAWVAETRYGCLLLLLGSGDAFWGLLALVLVPKWNCKSSSTIRAASPLALRRRGLFTNAVI